MIHAENAAVFLLVILTGSNIVPGMTQQTASPTTFSPTASPTTRTPTPSVTTPTSSPTSTSPTTISASTSNVQALADVCFETEFIPCDNSAGRFAPFGDNNELLPTGVSLSYTPICYTKQVTSALPASDTAVHPVRCYSPTNGFGYSYCASELTYADAQAVCESFQGDPAFPQTMNLAVYDFRIPASPLEAGRLCGSGCQYDFREAWVNFGNTPLILAAKDGHQDSTEALLEAGASVDAQDDEGYTALIWAAENGHQNIVEELLKGGASVNIQTSYGDTALIWAAQNGHQDSAEELLKGGASVNTQNNNGDTALALATVNGHQGIANDMSDSD